IDLILSGQESMDVLPIVQCDDAAIYQYTGGTTGVPKGAIGLHRNLVANILQFREWLVGLEEGGEVALAAIPLYHVYGMVIAMGVSVALGASIVLIRTPQDLSLLLSSIQQYGVTLFPGVPNLYAAINKNPDVLAGKYDLRTIKACISGSAPLLPEIKQQFEALTGGKLVEGYGLSEAPTATHCNPVHGENRTGSIGLPLPDVDARIVDAEVGDRQLAIGEVGELIIRSPQVMAGYHGMDEETKLALRKGWLYTGDLARMDEDGYFYLVDRKKDVIKIGGFQVWPREVEEVLALHPDIKDAAVAGVPDATYGEMVKAWIVLQEGRSISPGEVQGWCEERLARYKKPMAVEFIDTIPRTFVGKVLRRELVRMHQAGK
ncbi:MAG: AMP-binding protein, partial [Anaerolineae bacterium]|nr:AMP-binding protein [Anaerolineae bacterium]